MVHLTRAVWDAIESVPLETLASTDVVQRLHSVLAGAARAIAEQERSTAPTDARRGTSHSIPFLAPLQTQIDGPLQRELVVFPTRNELGERVLTIDVRKPSER